MPVDPAQRRQLEQEIVVPMWGAELLSSFLAITASKREPS